MRGAVSARGRRFDITVLHQLWTWAAGAVVATANDRARFYRALLDESLLRPDLQAELQTTVATPSPTS